MSQSSVSARLARLLGRSGTGNGLPTVDEALRLVYPAPVAAEVIAALGDDRPLADLAELRRLMAPFDRQTFPSAVQLHFGPEEVVECEVDGIRLVLDSADTSVSRTLIDTLVYEPHVTALFRRYLQPGMTMVDVGANVGYFSALASSLVGPDGHVLALEPNSDNCRLILLTMLANGAQNIELLPVAASSKRGWTHFSAHVGSNGGIIRSTSNDLRDGRGTVVASFPLDDLIDAPVHLLKLDVEGAEGMVLAGAQRLLRTHRPIVVSELSVEMLERVSSMSVADYVRTFTGLGYTCHVLDPDNTTSTPIDNVDQYLEEWTDIFRLEELLFLP